MVSLLRLKSFSGVLASVLVLALIQNVQASASCCSQNYKDCDAPWCGSTLEECNSCSGDSITFLENGALFSSCLARYSTCTNDKDGCCDGLICKDSNNFYSQCVPDDGTGGGGGDDDVVGGCCSQNYKDCDANWCGISKSQCDNCDGNELIYLEDGANTSGCEKRWGTCTDDPSSCCPGLECRFISTYYSQCLPGNGLGSGNDDVPDTDAPTDAPTTPESTGTPTDSPTTPESTGTPTDSPTSTVTNPSGCDDNPNAFFYKGKDVLCSEIAALGKQKRNRKCREGRRIPQECPAICDERCATPSPTVSPTLPREPCVDNTEPFEFKGETTSCADIAALGNQKRNRKCNEGRRLEIECPTICTDQCD